MLVGERIRQRRISLGLSADELALRLGKNRSTIYRYESNDIENLPITILDPLADALETTPAYLMGWEESKHPVNTKQIPVLGTIAAGQPIYAFENIEGYEIVPEDCGIDFCLKIKGDSMIGARIYDGDIVFIRKQPDVENGEIAAVIIDGENATLKRVYKENGMIILHAENPKFPNLIYTAKDRQEVKILGLVKCVKFEVM